MRSTALAAVATVAALATPAAAAERLSVKVGGYMDQYVGYTNVEDDSNSSLDVDGVDVQSDSEIHFKGSTVLDNGIEFGINVQLEANTSSDQIDESYMIIKGAFGEVNIGDENSAMYKMHVAPPQFGAEANDGDFISFVLSDATSISDSGFSRAPFGETAIEPARANDSTKITYYTPRVAGLMLGASYSPDINQDDNTLPDRNTETYTDGVMLGANYRRSFGNGFVEASAGYGTFLETSTGTDEPDALSFGLVAGIGGFSAGASFATMDGTGRNDGDAYNIGAAYETGPFAVSITYFHGEREGEAGSTSPSAAEAENDTYQLAGEYTLGPGVAVSGTLSYSEFSSDTAGVGDVDGTYFITGFHLRF